MSKMKMNKARSSQCSLAFRSYFGFALLAAACSALAGGDLGPSEFSPATGHYANVRQDGDFNNAYVTQQGYRQYSQIDQTAGGHNSIGVNQSVAQNRLQALQSGFNNQAVINQVGENNTLLLTQGGSYNLANVSQLGYGNSATVSQLGVGNTASVEQFRNDGRAVVMQIGSGQRATVIQY